MRLLYAADTFCFMPPVPVVYNAGMNKHEKIRVEEDERDQLARTFNARISTVCKFGALIISVITFVTTILNQYNTYFVVLGLSLAIALLALALLEDSRGKKE
ncbi:MAG: hypothetical protein RRX94_06045 [Raoultibacter sp.]